MSLATYIPSEVNVVYGGTLITGYFTGTRINITAPKDDWSVVEGIDLTSRSLMRSGLYVATITLQQTALVNDALSFFSNNDINTGAGAKSCSIIDSFGTSKIFSNAAFIRKKPDIEYAEEVTARAWAIVLTNVTGDIVGSNATI